MGLKEFVKSVVPPNTTLWRFMVAGYHLSKFRLWKPAKLNDRSVADVLDRYSQLRKPLLFVQIGSNDGIGEDPIRPFIVRDRWKGIMVEPLPATFKKLVGNYKTYQHLEDIAFENVAISDRNGTMPFFYIDAAKAQVPESSANKFSSFNKEVPLRLKWEYPGVEENILEIPIQTVTLVDLLKKHHLLNGGVNLLHIDTEGHDHVILGQIDFTRIRPDIILFENLHMKLDEYKGCVTLLRREKYRLFEHNLDTLAVHESIYDKVFEQV